MDRLLLAELQRRRVFRALIGYGIAAFAVLQIIEPIMHGLHWPDSVLSYVVAALAVGFPIVVSLAWIFDVKAGRIERTAPSPANGLRGTRLTMVLVGLGVLAATPGLVWYFILPGRARPTAESSAAPSIAVLPFADMSPGKDQEYFSDGIAEEILNALAQVEGLRVTGRTSSFSFKGKSEDLREIGQKLGVGTVLEGSVRKAGNRLRVTAQVIQVVDGFHLWSQTYDRDLTDIFAVQDEIARAVVEALRVKLLLSRAAPAKSRQTSPEALAQYMLGRQLWFRGAHARALAAYEKALEIDPQFASAWAGKGKALKDLGDQTGTPEAVRDGCKQGLEAVDKAVALDPALAEGFSARALIRCQCFFDWTGASSDAERALQLGPGDATSHRRHAILQLEIGRVPKAIAELRKTTEIDPLDPFAWNWLASAYSANGQFDLAHRSAERALEISPELSEVTFHLAAISLLEGRPAAALTIVEQVKSRDEVTRLTLLAAAHHDLGHFNESREALDALVAKAPVEWIGYSVAAVYAWWGDHERAFEWLERAYVEHDNGLSDIKWDPFLEKLHGDPRYAALLNKMNLPPD